ncbi:Myosin-cross-reactive_antigen [Hexamita inflata]|uniref:Putative n=1 Tax=Hexamita inflata TaxID=28002 RepID=A0AA86PP71_9EUKA|nr:Myosin-cross-reactive antigen [Hexamita inflata]
MQLLISAALLKMFKWDEANHKLTAKTIQYVKDGKKCTVLLNPQDLLFIQNGSMTDSYTRFLKEPAKFDFSQQKSFQVWGQTCRKT